MNVCGAYCSRALIDSPALRTKNKQNKTNKTKQTKKPTQPNKRKQKKTKENKSKLKQTKQSTQTSCIAKSHNAMTSCFYYVSKIVSILL